MQRLSTLDASFLRVETPTAHMHVGWLAQLELPSGSATLDAQLLAGSIASRLHLAPRFRQRVTRVPLRVTEPVWLDDPEFDIWNHVRIHDDHVVGQRELGALTDAFLSEQLDRDRPLWQILVVPRVRRGRAAILGKVHHAMVDGVAAVELGLLLFDLAPEPAPVDPVDWQPEPPAPSLRLAADALADSALDQFRAVRRVAALRTRPGEAARVAGTLRRAALSLAEDTLRAAPSSYLNEAIGPQRTLVSHSVCLTRLLALRRHLGVTLNDVVLAVCAGALRRFAERCGKQPDDLRVMVPVSVRGTSDAAAQGNRITFAFVDLPVSVPAAMDRLGRITEQMAELKTSGRIGGSAAILGGLGLMPEPLKQRAAQLAASPRLYNLTISNVPGPRLPLYAAGARVGSVTPVIPIPDRHALSIGVLTYDGAAHFGLHADPAVLPRVRGLPLLIDDALAELEPARPSPPRPQARRSPQRRKTTIRT